jgi:hypothetical protein
MFSSKIIVAAACVGFFLSFFTGLFSGIGFGLVLLRAVIFAALLAALFLGIKFVFERFLDMGEFENSPVPSEVNVGTMVDVTVGDDELTEEEQARMRVKAIETRWQNLEYDEYFECVYDVGQKEDAKIYALFPFGAPCVRAYYMLESWDNIIQKGGDFDESTDDGNRVHLAVDMYSRSLAKKILDREKR